MRPTRTRQSSSPNLTPQQIDKLAQQEQSQNNPTRYRKPVEEWDLVELARGRPRAADGSFKGRNPKWISSEVLEESRRRFQAGALVEVEANMDLAIKVIANILSDPDVDPRIRLDSAKFIVNHVLGTPKVKAEIVTNSPFATLIASSLINPDGSDSHPQAAIAAHEIIDSTTLEDEEIEEL